MGTPSKTLIRLGAGAINGISVPFWWNDISSTNSAALHRTLHPWQIENHQALAELAGGRFEVIPQSENDMRAPLERLAEELDHQCVLTYRAGPRVNALAGSRALEIRVARPGVRVRSRRAIDFTQMHRGAR